MNPPFLTVALTGGIASGKSTVAQHFLNHGACVISTDRIAYELLQPKSPILDQVQERLGAEVMHSNGELDRSKLRTLVFENAETRQTLNEIMHPAILHQCQKQIAACEAPYCVIEIPLLAEIGTPDFIDRVLVVDLPEEVQLQRLNTRDQRSSSENQNILAAQAKRNERLSIANDVIDNSGSLDDLATAVEGLHAKYSLLAAMETESIR